MKIFEIVWCFTRENGEIWHDDEGKPQIYVNYIQAKTSIEALEKFKQQEQFVNSPDILNIKSVRAI